MPGVALETVPGDLVVFNHLLKHASFGGSARRRMFVINCCEHVTEEQEAEHHTIETLVNGHAKYGLKSMYDWAILDSGSRLKHRNVHLKQILTSPAHSAMEQTRNHLREELRRKLAYEASTQAKL